MSVVFTIFAAVGLWLGAENAEPKKPVTVKPKREASARAEAKDPVEQEYEKLIADDEASLNDVEKWVKEYQEFADKGAVGPKAALAAKIEARLEQVKKGYEEFLAKHPKHINGMLAYGSFLNETGSEEEAIVQWEKARELDPKNPTPWNNLANIFGHIGPVKKAFQYYEKAVELDPNEPVYLQNLATTVYLFRKDAAETYRIDEKQIFDKALDLYRRAMKLDPTNLVLATDYAQSYYGIKPTRVEEAIAAWNHALKLAQKPVEKQGIYLHLARVELNNGLFKEAEQHLAEVRDAGLEEMKQRLIKNLNEKRARKESEQRESPAAQKG